MIAIDTATKQQRIEGFIAANEIEPLMSDEVADFFWTRDKGIGFTHSWICIDHNNGGLLVSPSSTAPVGNEATAENCRKIYARGGKLVARPLWFHDGWASGQGANYGGVLLSQYAQQWADLIAGVPQALRDIGCDLWGMLVTNEPNGTLFCQWTPQQLHDFIVNYWGPTLRARWPDLKLIGPETSHFNKFFASYADVLLDDPISAQYIDILSCHSYDAYDWTQGADPNTSWIPAHGPYPKAGALGKQLWATEFSGAGYYDYDPKPIPPNPQWYPHVPTTNNDSIDHGLLHAAQIHYAFEAGWSTWGMWLFVNSTCQNYPNHNWPNYPGYSTGCGSWGLADGSDLANPSTYQGGYFIAGVKRLWAQANYSKFIRPGYHHVPTTGAPSGVLVSSYVGDDGDVVVVAINQNSVATPIDVAGIGAHPHVTPWVTDVSNDLVPQADIVVSGGTFSAVLAPRSVTSFVRSLSVLTDNPARGTSATITGRCAAGTTVNVSVTP